LLEERLERDRDKKSITDVAKLTTKLDEFDFILLNAYRSQFHQHFTPAFLYKILAQTNFKPKTQLCNIQRQNFVQKMRA